MLRPRITPCLLVQNGGLVKTVQFKAARYIGDPINAIKIFNEKETDELIVLDIDATAHGLEPNFRLISQFAVECRMPLSYGGGIKTPAQAKRIILHCAQRRQRARDECAPTGPTIFALMRSADSARS